MIKNETNAEIKKSFLFKIINPLYKLNRKIQHIESIESVPFIIRAYTTRCQDSFKFTVKIGRGAGFPIGRTIYIIKNNKYSFHIGLTNVLEDVPKVHKDESV